MQRSYINAECRRWMVVGALTGFCALFGLGGTPSIWAQTQGALTVRSVALVGTNAITPEIEVKTSGPVAPATQAVTNPDRIIIDFPGALPASTLRALSVHRGGLKSVRTALFQAQPPITRVVLDVDGPTNYQVIPSGNSIVVKLDKSTMNLPMRSPEMAKAPVEKIERTASVKAVASTPTALAARASTRAARPAAAELPALQVVNTTATPATAVIASTAPAPPPRPSVVVGVRSNLLSIRAQGATLAEVLYEVHRRTGADIAIPAGAEQERVVVNMGPAPGKEVIASLLNGSRFNYILVGSDSDPGGFKNLLLSLKSGGNSGVFVRSSPPQFASGALGGQPPAIASGPGPGMEQPIPEQAVTDQAGLSQAEPELEPIPDEAPAPETDADVVPSSQRPNIPQQFPVQNIPEAGQLPQ